MEDDISGIERKQILGKAATAQPEQSEAVASLAADYSQIRKEVGKIASGFGQDADDYIQDLALKFLTKGDSLHEIRSLPALCRTATRNACINDYRRQKKERECLDELTRDSVQSKRKSSGGGTIVEQRSNYLTPEQELMEMEEAPLRERQREIKLRQQREQLGAGLRKLFSSLSQGHEKIVRLSLLEAKAVKVIVKETGTPTSTVYRVLGEFYKEFFEATGIGDSILKNPEFADALRALVVEILGESR